MEELPELRESRCSTRASFVVSSSFNALSAAIRLACSPMNTSSCSCDIASGSSTRRSNYGRGATSVSNTPRSKDSARHLAVVTPRARDPHQSPRRQEQPR